jgi:hypothetical protein
MLLSNRFRIGPPQDAGDVEALIRKNQIDLADETIKALFLKYGSREIYETFVSILRLS